MIKSRKDAMNKICSMHGKDEKYIYIYILF